MHTTEQELRTSTLRPDWYLVGVDGSQWELRVMTAWGKIKYWMKVYQDGLDFHGAMCDLLYGQEWTKAMRKVEKNIVFGLSYGGQLESLVSVGHLTMEQKGRVFQVFNTELQDFMAWREEMFMTAWRDGRIVVPWFGSVIDFGFIPQGYEYTLRKIAVNWPVQGTASRITMDAGVHAGPRLRRLGAHLILPVHDQLIAEARYDDVPEVVDILGQELSASGSRFSDTIPWKTEAEWGRRWGELHKFSIENWRGNAKVHLSR